MQHPERGQPQPAARIDRWRKRLAVALVPIALAAGAAVLKHRHDAQQVPPAAAPSAQRGAASAAPPMPLADFRGEAASADARLVANWVVATGDHQNHAFIVVDKKEAEVYVFTPQGRLKDSAPVLLGAAVGDEILPGAGGKTPARMRPEEKTTPAGRFVAEPGTNADDEDVLWVDYDDGISMHRVRPWVPSEQRLERLASLTTEDNRVSFGCINLPVSFYEDVVRPAATHDGAVVYVLPEVKTPQQVFGAYDVTDPQQVAAARQRSVAAAPADRAARPTAQG